MAREEIKAKEKGAEGLPGEASVVSDGQRWRSGSSGGPFSSILYVLLCFSLLLFLSSYFFLFFLPSFSFFSVFFPSFLLLSIPILLLSSFSQFLFVFFSFSFSLFFLALSLPLFSSFSAILLSLSSFFSFFSVLSSILFCSRSPLSCAPFFVMPPCFYRQKQGRDVAGVATVLPPHNCLRGTFPLFFTAPW